MRARRRPFFPGSQFSSSCFTPRPDSGVVTRQVAHVMEAAVLPSRQAQACRCAARGASLPSGQAPSPGPAHRFLRSVPSCLSSRLPICCPGSEFPLQSKTWPAYPALFHRLAPKKCGYPCKRCQGQAAAHVASFSIKPLIIKGLSGLSKAFPQACTQKVWISPRSASLGAALRRMTRFAKKLPGFASGGVFPL